MQIAELKITLESTKSQLKRQEKEIALRRGLSALENPSLKQEPEEEDMSVNLSLETEFMPIALKMQSITNTSNDESHLKEKMAELQI